MPTHDLTPEEWEDLITTDHCCDERCFDHGHSLTSVDDEEDDQQFTALALFECGPAGIRGSRDGGQVTSLLWRRATQTLGLQGVDPDDARALARIAEKYEELLDDWKDEERARGLILRAQRETERAVREVERTRAAAARASSPRVDHRSPNRPTRIDVDPNAWAIVKRKAAVDGVKVAEAVGALLMRKPPAHLPKVSAKVSPNVERRFARLFVDDDRWAELRGIAIERYITVSRLVGLIVEHRAKQLGWAPKVGR